jgi:TRAP-type C4-dicarboxylate transport system substrate-binding protein
VQAWVQQAADESMRFQRELWSRKTAEALALAEREGVTIYEVDTAAFAARVAPMLENIENPQVREMVRKIAEVP